MWYVIKHRSSRTGPLEKFPHARYINPSDPRSAIRFPDPLPREPSPLSLLTECFNSLTSDVSPIHYHRLLVLSGRSRHRHTYPLRAPPPQPLTRSTNGTPACDCFQLHSSGASVRTHQGFRVCGITKPTYTILIHTRQRTHPATLTPLTPPLHQRHLEIAQSARATQDFSVDPTVAFRLLPLTSTSPSFGASNLW